MSTSKVIPFKCKGGKKTGDGDVLEHGQVGGLNFEVFKRGCIHIFNKDLRFKKDTDKFEDEFEQLSFDDMEEGDERVIKGSGDNPDIIFACKDDDIKMSLKKKQFKTIEKLKSILNKGIKRRST